MKLSSTILWGYENFKSNSYGVQNLVLEKIFGEVNDQRLKEKIITDIWK